MGTPEFAVPSLQRLLEDGHTVVGVFTQPDKPKGRGHKLASPPVKGLAVSQEIPVFQPKTLRNEESAALLRELAPEVMIVVAYGKILPLEILAIPKQGCINVHASLLPRYRGAGPIQWSVLNGEKVTGVTTMYMAEGIDTGDMLLQAETTIGENETAGELHDRLSQMGAELLSNTLRELEQGTLKRIPQDDTQSTHAPMLTKEMSVLDFSRPAEKLHNQIRGLSPWPCAETVFQGKRLKVYHSAYLSQLGHTGRIGDCPPGTILDSKEFIVQCGEGFLQLTEVQYEGSRRMSGGEFLRGRPPVPDECLGNGSAQ